MTAPAQSVFTIPAGVPFAKTLARTLFEKYGNTPETLADITILLPTRRACRVVQNAFLDVSEGQALILPRLQTIGDIDEEELALNLMGKEGVKNLLNLPPSISPLKRQLLLARLIQSAETFTQGFDHALVLAAALGRFIDQIYTENLEMQALANIVPAEFANHWQITLDFLEILSKAWPKILKEEAVIDIADRRNRLILALAEYWETYRPNNHIIAAGTTGSIPAVAKLLSVISTLPHGEIILPGLDQHLDEDSWNLLEETHPQFGLKQLTERIPIERKDVQLWDKAESHALSKARRALCRSVMRPADTTHQWTAISTDAPMKATIEAALENLHLLECADEGEEAQTIAILMRETLETPHKTAALITPDRNLARRVSMACRRWGITLDDSAGQNLNQSPVGSFFNLLIAACTVHLSPIALLSLLKHDLCRIIEKPQIELLEITALRGPKPQAGLDALREKIADLDDETQRILSHIIEAMDKGLTPLLKLCHGQHSFKTLLKTHIEAAENLCVAAENLWDKEEGEALSLLFSDLLDQAHYMPDVNAETYAQIITQIMSGVTIRPKYGTHPRLRILGQLEARLIDADLVIMAGLNEGTWPPDLGHDPWLSRPMRKEFGLPAHERSVGLAAHDFVQGFCSPNIALTRALRSAGSPTIPARWLQRLNTVIEAAGLSKDRLETAPHKEWAQNMDQTEIFLPCTRPAPTPPVEARPTALPATRIETWLKDPYAIYARYILKLKALDPLEQEADSAQRGTVLHDVLERFVTAHPEDIPENAQHILRAYAEEDLNEQDKNTGIWQFWWPRFERLSQWFIDHEHRHRKTHKNPQTEIQGETVINGFTLTARADRIDQGVNGAVIIDYKSAGTYSKKSMQTGDAPQLPIEALILAEGGFKEINSKAVESLEYWILSGKSSGPGKITAERRDIETLIERTRENIQNLIHIFGNEKTPYYSLPREGYAPRFNDYEHLARVKEWATLENAEQSEKVA